MFRHGGGGVWVIALDEASEGRFDLFRTGGAGHVKDSVEIDDVSVFVKTAVDHVGYLAGERGTVKYNNKMRGSPRRRCAFRKKIVHERRHDVRLFLRYEVPCLLNQAVFALGE